MRQRFRHLGPRSGAVLLVVASSAAAACGGAAPAGSPATASATTLATPVTSTGPATPGPAASGPAGTPGPGPASATVSTRVPQPPGAHGDGYTRNVTAGAACPRNGALGFTADARAVRCATTPADQRLRWLVSGPGSS